MRIHRYTFRCICIYMVHTYLYLFLCQFVTTVSYLYFQYDKVFSLSSHLLKTCLPLTSIYLLVCSIPLYITNLPATTGHIFALKHANSLLPSSHAQPVEREKDEREGRWKKVLLIVFWLSYSIG